jgi:hypothetical protein
VIQIGDYLYMLNMQSETYSNYSFNPYYGRISVFRVPLKDYLEPEIDKNLSYEVCMTDLVPGVITHFSLSHKTKDKLAINYRRVDITMGSIHRFRLYHNITSCQLN